MNLTTHKSNLKLYLELFKRNITGGNSDKAFGCLVLNPRTLFIEEGNCLNIQGNNVVIRDISFYMTENINDMINKETW